MHFCLLGFVVFGRGGVVYFRGRGDVFMREGGGEEADKTTVQLG